MRWRNRRWLADTSAVDEPMPVQQPPLRSRDHVVAVCAATLVAADAAIANKVGIGALAAHHRHTAAVAYGAGAAGLLLVAALTGYVWRRGPIVETYLLACVGAACVAAASFVAWNPIAGSTTCPGTTDCDTGFGLAACILWGVVLGPLFLSALLGRALARRRRRASTG
jgi:hypothetical protein